MRVAQRLRIARQLSPDYGDLQRIEQICRKPDLVLQNCHWDTVAAGSVMSLWLNISPQECNFVTSNHYMKFTIVLKSFFSSTMRQSLT